MSFWMIRYPERVYVKIWFSRLVSLMLTLFLINQTLFPLKV
ncbi:unnamed protein product [Larinioides sclopetarius]|uniref:NADH dehydrogenase subunit 1 n=1 Tax=Larinioides sclopetarius TaxID=280406 RepID=A0AAV2BYU6_9ARAC